MAGGPLVVGLVLGALERTGPITWQLPYNANLTLRQLGAVLFLAGVGIRSGHAFVGTVRSSEGLVMLVVGAAVTVAAAVLAVWLGMACSVPVVLRHRTGCRPSHVFRRRAVGRRPPEHGLRFVYPVLLSRRSGSRRSYGRDPWHRRSLPNVGDGRRCPGRDRRLWCLSRPPGGSGV
jgi:hypothetical protein